MTTNTVPRSSNDLLRPAGAVAGVAFAVIGLLSGVIAPPGPAADAPAAKIRDWVISHHSTLNVASVLVMVGPVILMFFFGAMRRRMADTDLGSLFLAFGTLTVALALVGGALECVLIHGGAQLSNDSTVQLLFHAWRVVFDGGPAVASTGYMLVVGMAARNSGVPAWLGSSAVVIGLLGLVGGVTAVVSGNGGPPAFGLVGFLLNMAWVVAASVTVLGFRSAD